jgi:hypothetical protein
MALDFGGLKEQDFSLGCKSKSQKELFKNMLHPNP